MKWMRIRQIQKMIFKIVSIGCICGCLLIGQNSFGGLGSQSVYAFQPLKIVVIGDSIAKGIGSSDKASKSYGAVLTEKLQADLTNLGISGLDSSQLLEKLDTKKFQTALADADVIFISIGSNDLLKPFLATVSDSLGADTEKGEVFKAIEKRFAELSRQNVLVTANALSNVVHEMNDSETLNQACEKFPNNFNKIIQNLKNNYPDAIIYANNVYNPYYGVAYDLNGVSIMNIHQLCEGYVQKINMAFTGNGNDYQLMDMYSIFQQEGYTNVNKGSIANMGNASFDPHPNDAGYQLMADYIYTRMDSIVPTAVLVKPSLEPVPIMQENIVIQFSEAVRTVGGKQIYIKQNGKEYAYTFAEGIPVTANEDGNYELTLPLSNWFGEVATQGLQYNTEYTVYTQPGTWKDKGNNSTREEVLGSFTTEKKTEPEVMETMGNAKKAVAEEREVSYIIWIASGIFVLIAVGIVVFIMKRRKT